MYMNLAILMYKWQYMPLEWRFQNYIDLFNEVCICLCSVHLLLFTDWVQDMDVRYAYGWSMIVIMCLNFFVNIIIVLWFGGKQVYQLLRKMYYKLLIQWNKFLKWLKIQNPT